MKNKNELIASSKHLYYEIWMLRLLANKLLNYSVGLGDTEEENENIVEIRAVTHTSSPSVYCYSTDVAYSPPSVEENDLIVGNALLESFGIHLRSLINFFYPDKKRSQDDDVSSHHYFQDYHIWEKNRPLHSQEQLNEIIKRVSKEIAHLTYSRNNPTRIKKDWEILEHKNMIFEALKVFLANVDKSLLSDEWKKPF